VSFGLAGPLFGFDDDRDPVLLPPIVGGLTRPAASVRPGLTPFSASGSGRLRFDRRAGQLCGAVEQCSGLRILLAEQVPRVQQHIRRLVRPVDQVVERGVRVGA